jgi:uncharacterized protein YcfJ
VRPEHPSGIAEVVMRKILFPLMVVLMAVATAGFAQAPPPPSASADNVHYGWADVLRVDPVYASVQVERPRQQCYEQPVVRQERGNGTAGTVLGAVIGGVLGNTIGKGDGRKAATVAGAVVGGAVGNSAAHRNDADYPDSVTRCDEVRAVSNERQLVGYDVEYRYRGEVYLSRLNYDPGERLRVRVAVSPAD